MSAPPGTPPGPPPPRPTTTSSIPPPPPPSATTTTSTTTTATTTTTTPSTSTTTTSATTPSTSSTTQERNLTLEKSTFFQELELERVLSAFRLNPYDVLQVPMEADEKEINKIYRKKSLLLHPDKVKDPRAIEAFDLLKKASSHLLDPEKRRNLDETVLAARVLCLKGLGLPTTLKSDDDRVKDLNPSLEERVRKETKNLMIDDEVRRRKAIKIQHAAEGEAERKKEEAANERKRKAEESQKWEENREDRVAGWRSFQKGTKKKKKNDNVLG